MCQQESCLNNKLTCAALVIALCATALGAAASVVDLRVAEIVAVAMRPIA